MHPSFVASPFLASRRRTLEVAVGDVRLGGDQPIRIQSMTTTDTRDTAATVDQVERLADAGCEIVRLTAPSIRDAWNLEAIRAELRRRRVAVPIVADIHFTPNAALVAAYWVEKVRINPGNYADKKKFEVREYSDDEYRAELERVGERFRPLVRLCRERGVALRIGTNHGSLSDRIMNRYGDTPLGMVESAIEFLDVCEDEGFDQIVFSMKASNPQVAIHAYRLLAERLEARAPGRPSYPFHVGVTEAGDGEDGRIKSAIGIGSLLEDGIGDTIRVSLTEDPVRELPVAVALARRSEARWREDAACGPIPAAAFVDDPYAHARRACPRVDLGGLVVGDREPVRVELDLGPAAADPGAAAAAAATARALEPELALEGLALEAPAGSERLELWRRALAELGLDQPLALRVEAADVERFAGRAARLVVPVAADVAEAGLRQAAAAAARAGTPVEWCLRGEVGEVPALLERALQALGESGAHAFSVESRRGPHAVRRLAAALRGRVAAPIVLRHRRAPEVAEEQAALDAAVDLGAPLCDGIGDAISLAGFAPDRGLDLAYRILQGARLRTTRTEYISCPSCGRTLFDLEETTARIKAQTADLRGVKIAVMGCIVNGPGEMADADFGYVGAGAGLVNLYQGRQVVLRGVPESEAPQRLVDLIRERGRCP